MTSLGALLLALSTATPRAHSTYTGGTLAMLLALAASRQEVATE